MAVTFTKEQQETIDARNASILVSAAAGSGKTAVLVERIIQMVKDPVHPVDIDRLLVQLNRLVEAGHSVVVVEHDMRVVAQSDWVIDIGPGAGDAGGKVVVSGPPKVVAACADSRTAAFLAKAL